MAAAGDLLVVDDHREIREALEAFLSRCGFAVSTAPDAAAARHRLAQGRGVDLVVLDVMLPGDSGLALCRELSAAEGPPVILLSALSAPADRISGLEMGAEDYVVKPFDPQELAARIRTVMRRCRPATAAPESLAYRFASWVFDPRQRELSHDDGRRVALSAAESRLLAVLLQRPGEVLSRDRLLDLCGDAEIFDRSIDTQVSRLRRKMEADPRRPSLLKTAWGDGYLIAVDVARVPAVPAVAAAG